VSFPARGGLPSHPSLAVCPVLHSPQHEGREGRGEVEAAALGGGRVGGPKPWPCACSRGKHNVGFLRSLNDGGDVR